MEGSGLPQVDEIRSTGFSSGTARSRLVCHPARRPPSRRARRTRGRYWIPWGKASFERSRLRQHGAEASTGGRLHGGEYVSPGVSLIDGACWVLTKQSAYSRVLPSRLGRVGT